MQFKKITVSSAVGYIERAAYTLSYPGRAKELYPKSDAGRSYGPNQLAERRSAAIAKPTDFRCFANCAENMQSGQAVRIKNRRRAISSAEIKAIAQRRWIADTLRQRKILIFMARASFCIASFYFYDAVLDAFKFCTETQQSLMLNFLPYSRPNDRTMRLSTDHRKPQTARFESYLQKARWTASSLVVD